MKKFILYFLSSLLILTIIYFGTNFLSDYKLGLTDVYVAKNSINQRELIKESDLKIIKVPKAYVDENVFNEIEDIVGKYVKQNAKVAKGSLFYKELLDEKSNIKDNLHLDLKDDEVTYDLYTRDIKVNPAYLLKDMYVDLYLTINRKEVLSDLLISNVRILNLYDLNNKEIKDYDKEATLQTISIAVKKEMVPFLNKAITLGEINLVVGADLYQEEESTLNTNSSVYNYLK